METLFFPFLSSTLVLQAAIQSSPTLCLEYITVIQEIKNTTVHFTATRLNCISKIHVDILKIQVNIFKKQVNILEIQVNILKKQVSILNTSASTIAKGTDTMNGSIPFTVQMGYCPVYILHKSTFINIAVLL